MDNQTKPVQFEEFISNAPSIFAKIEHEGGDILVEHEGSLFSIQLKSSKRAGNVITPEDSISDIIGIGASQGPADTSSNIHAYLADAYDDVHKV